MAEKFAYGVMHQQWAEAAISDSESLARTVSDVQLADELGFDSFMFGEHHFPRGKAFPGRIPFPEHVVAHLAALTGRIKLGTGVKVLSIDKVWRTVESMLTLDLISGGRTFFGLGAGGDEPNIFLPEQIGALERRAKFRDAIDELLELLKSQGTSFFPEPLGPLSIDSNSLVDRLLIAARDEPTIRFAAHHQLKFVMGQSETVKTQAPYVETYHAAGGRNETRVVRIVIIADTVEDALEIARPTYEAYSFNGFLKSRYYLEAVEKGHFDGAMPRDLADGMNRMGFIVGDPESVAAQLSSYQSATNADRLDIMVHLPVLAAEDSRRSLRLFAQEVVPLLEPVTAGVL